MELYKAEEYSTPEFQYTGNTFASMDFWYWPFDGSGW